MIRSVFFRLLRKHILAAQERDARQLSVEVGLYDDEDDANDTNDSKWTDSFLHAANEEVRLLLKTRMLHPQHRPLMATSLVKYASDQELHPATCMLSFRPHLPSPEVRDCEGLHFCEDLLAV